MPKNISRNEIVNICFNGVEQARKRYEIWSGGWSLRSAPESLTQVVVAEILAKKLPYITLEDKVSYLIDMSGAKKGVIIPGNKLGRVDITLWNQNSTPRMVIEIKKTSGKKSISDDTHRIKKLIERCPSIQAGIVVAITHASKKGTLAKRFDDISKESCITEYSLSPVTETVSKKDKHVYFGCACYVVKNP
jgi:hypothetical protein